MNGPIKIYCVLFDTMPLNEFIINFAKSRDATLLRQVGGCFTNNTCIEMMTGQLPSDLIDHGMGHTVWKKYRNEDDSDVNWPWSDKILFHKLHDNGWGARYHNGEHFQSMMSNRNFIKKTTCKQSDLTIISLLKEAKIALAKESKIIKKVQASKPKKNMFYLFRHIHFHTAAMIEWKRGKKKGRVKEKLALERTKKIIKSWDFNEPNAIFWFFSDHGKWFYPHSFSHPLPENYLSWAVVKDNTKDPICPLSKFISAQDFFPTIMDKANCQSGDRCECVPVTNSQDKNRIYYVEDGRKDVNELISTTAMACKVIKWNKERPKQILQVSYHEVDNSWVCMRSFLDKKGFIKKTQKERIVNEELKKSVIKRFNWVN